MVETFGFRGEAISSLCALADVQVTTCTQEDRPLATKIILDSNGEIKSTSVSSGKKGTSILISNLFSTLPVRRKDFVKNSKREFSKALTLIQAYAIVCEGVKISVSNTTGTGKGKKSVLMSTNGSGGMKNNIASIYGLSIFESLIPLKISFNMVHQPSELLKKLRSSSSSFNSLKRFSSNPEGNEDVDKEKLSKEKVEEDDSTEIETSKVVIEGFISKPIFGQGRSASDRQFYYINSRVCNLPQITKTVNEVYKSFNNTQVPVVFANIKMDTSKYDVNVSPDKRTILLHDEGLLVELIRENLTTAFEKAGHSVPKNTLSGSSRITQGKIFSSLLAQRDDSRDRNSVNIETDPGSDNDNDTASPKLSDVDQNKFQEPQHTQKNLPRTAHRVYNSETLVDEEDKTKDNYTKVSLYSSMSPSPQRTASKRTSTTLIGSNEIPSYDDPVEVRIGDNIEVIKLKKPRTSLRKFDTTISSSSIGPLVQKVYPDGTVIRPASSEFNSASGKETNEDGDDSMDLDPDNSVSSDDKAGESTETSEKAIEEPSNNKSKLGDHAHTDASQILSSQDSSEVSSQKTRTISKSNSQRPSSAKSNAIYRYRTHNYNMGIQVNLDKLKKSAKDLDTVASETSNSIDGISSSLLMSNSKKKTKALSDITVSDIAEDEELVESMLSLSIHKEDFAKMDIVGQFNLGFILVTKTSPETGKKDLFIVDQHASDEIYNFERLQKTTKIQNQPLVIPMQLKLTAMEELTVLNNKNIFEDNGFVIEINEEEPPGSKCKLISIPISKSTTFDIKDIQELIYLIDTHPGQKDIKCSKLRSMFAMRACRSSIMIGKPLTKKIMTTVVRHLSSLDKPWNCPHGRPTMRHLANLGQFSDSFEYPGRQI